MLHPVAENKRVGESGHDGGGRLRLVGERGNGVGVSQIRSGD